ncbi:dipeptide epimerase [Actinoplanes sp. NPDC049265]|uniref:dipeptide epimerase n=1 Tax=Actinoplanes sp. NPDC049265 TaxID=3363902 RepID=UPI003714F892
MESLPDGDQPGARMKLTWESYPLRLREPLRISRSTMAFRGAVRISLSDGEHTGHGEVVTSVHHRLDLPTITAACETLAGPPALGGFPAIAAGGLGPVPPGVRAAVDAALLDLRGKQAGMPVYALLGLPAATAVVTAYTIGLVSPNDAATAALGLAAGGFGVLKIKAGDQYDVARIAAVRRAAPGVRLWIDPNGGWTPTETLRVLAECEQHRIDMVEQPVPPGAPDRLAWISERTPIPVVADEDAATEDDVDRLAGAVDGINIKLAKCGGVTAALSLAAKAREHGLEIMLGCLVASSLGIAPAVHLAGLARWIDLDGHLLLNDDPHTGIGGHGGTLRLSGEPGLGIRRKI